MHISIYPLNILEMNW